MRKLSVITLATVTFLAVMPSAFAMGWLHHGGHDPNPPSSGGHSYGVPGPVAGVGIPALIMGGGYLWIVRRRKRAQSTKEEK